MSMRRSRGGQEGPDTALSKIQISFNSHYKITKSMPRDPPPRSANSNNRIPPPLPMKNFLDIHMFELKTIH